MKLAAQYNKASVIISLLVLLISAIVYYQTINHIARQQFDDNLTEEVDEVVDYVNQNQKLPKAVDFDEEITTFVKTNAVSYKTIYFDSEYLNLKEKKREEGRAVSALIKLKGQNYIVTIVESMEDMEYLVQTISIITAVLAALFLLIFIFTNKFLLSGLWRPFYNILHKVKQFNISDAAGITATETRIDEFSELNDELLKMSSRVSSDYTGLKTFTENASHEMLTPIALITSKLDTLIQDERLQADQLSQITDIYSATNKLSRLNQSLLLLVKIDNNLIPDKEAIDVKTVIEEKIQQFNELVLNKKITLSYHLTHLEIDASRYLIDILINNLFSNAIRHNKNLGVIKINLSQNKLIFQNSGDDKPLDSDMIFTRFHKSKASDGIGLGLSIIKNICNKYQFESSYEFIDGLHTFTIGF